MSMLKSRRLQVLVDDDLYDRLELVRRALEREFPASDADRLEAGRRLLGLSAPPGEGPEPDWVDQKRELIERRFSGA
jgi:hypothetical protein